jgi:L-rhamnose mutarotase
MISNACGMYHLFCDVCGEKLFKVFHEFQDAVNYKKQNGWKSQRRNGEWEDVCPDCQEGNENDES